MSNLTQDIRFISIKTPLPVDELLLTSFEGTEYISDLFAFQIEVLSSNHSIKPEDLIGQSVIVSIHDQIEREFNGYISSFTHCEVKADNLSTYRMTLVPWLWFLLKNNNHRIFQEKTTKDIVTQIFNDLGFNDYDFKATGNTNVREYCVQHNESDLNFISRLLEEDGIAYFFEHKDGKHVMQIVDEANAYQECAETDLTYSRGNQIDKQISRWLHNYEFRKGKWSLNDYDFKAPTKSQLQTTASTSEFANVKEYEHYEYTPSYDFTGLRDLTKKRIEAEEIPMNVIRAASNCSSFYAGGTFKLEKHPVVEETGTYLISGIRHSAYDNSYFSDGDSESDYSNEFTCIPGEVHYRPPLLHPKPVMAGPQSAIVVGPAGEEIYVDEFGRIKVQFHWDRIGENDENSTCFIQVMQPWAGSGWGTSFIPRIGMEVVVNYYNGDVDRPIIMGTVYNGDNKPPFDSKNQSGIRTRSTTGGSSSNCNELRFDDSAGSEELYIHAEKNLNVKVKNDVTQTVDNNLTQVINNDLSQTVVNNVNIDVAGDHIENVAGDTNFNFGGDINITVAGSTNKWTYCEEYTGVYGYKGEFFGGLKQSIFAGGLHETLLGAKVTTNLSLQTEIVAGVKLTVNKIKELKKNKIYDETATISYDVESPKITFNGGKTIILKVGKTELKITKKGIIVKGKVIFKDGVKVKGPLLQAVNRLKAKNITSG